MTAPLTPEQIAELKVLMEKATPGPWSARREDERGKHFIIRTTRGGFGYLDVADVSPWEAHDLANAMLIVELRNAAPALLAAAERVGAANITASRLVACELRRSKYALRAHNAEARIVELEAALAKEKERAERAITLASSASSRCRIVSTESGDGIGWDATYFAEVAALAAEEGA